MEVVKREHKKQYKFKNGDSVSVYGYNFDVVGVDFYYSTAFH